MNNRLRFLLLTLFLTTAACAPSVTPAPTVRPAALPLPTSVPATLAPTIVPATRTTAPVPATLAPTLTVAPVVIGSSDFESARAMEHNRMLAVTIGKRDAATEGNLRAGEYIAQQFASFGYQVEKQPFTFEPWEDLGTHVKISAPDSRDLESQALTYSPAGHVEAKVVAVSGVGAPEDFTKIDAKNKIVLIQRGTIRFSDKAKNAASAGAVGILIYNNVAGMYAGTLGERVPIPALAISGKDGSALLESLAKGALVVRIDSDTQVKEKNGYNIIGTKRGTSGKSIVLGGHYDSIVGPGAVDNASGTSVVIELARALAQRETKDTLVFIAFDAEEGGLIGSQNYVKNLSEQDRAKIIAMLNFDMLGGGSGQLTLSGDGTIGKAAREAASNLGIQARNARLDGGSSDHASFVRVGIDAVFFWRNYDLLHTPQDAIDQIREEFLAEAGKVGLKTIMDLQTK